MNNKNWYFRSEKIMLNEFLFYSLKEGKILQQKSCALKTKKNLLSCQILQL